MFFSIKSWADSAVTIKKANSSEFIKVNVEAIRNAVERYDITVEANSSSFDDLENRRADAIALKNILIEAKNSEVNIDMEEGFRKVFNTFENIDADKLIVKEENNWEALENMMWGMQPQGNIPAGKSPAKWANPQSPEWLTQAVAWWASLF